MVRDPRGSLRQSTDTPSRLVAIGENVGYRVTSGAVTTAPTGLSRCSASNSKQSGRQNSFLATVGGARRRPNRPCWPWCPSSRVQRQCRISSGQVWSVHANSHLRCPLAVPGSGSSTVTCASGSWPGLFFPDRRRQNFDGPPMSASRVPLPRTRVRERNARTESISARNTHTANLT
jgi:hypothetical protein